MPDNWVFATGRRKSSTARIMIKAGKGQIEINGKKPQDYFPTKTQAAMIKQPLTATDNVNKYDFKITVKGGGFSGQTGAILHGMARALLQVDPDSKTALSKTGLLTRDSRMVERKKAGQPKARKRFQFSKR